MAQDADRELEALSLAEATIGDVSDEVSEVQRDFSLSHGMEAAAPDMSKLSTDTLLKTTHTTPGLLSSKRLGTSQDQIVTFCRRWMVAEMALFGSVLRDDFRPDSDIDVLVDFLPDATWSLFDISRMRLELSSLFGREADLVQTGGLRNPFRRRTILSNREVIYGSRR